MLNAESRTGSRITLPQVPTEYSSDLVAAWSEPVNIDSYLPDAPSAYPAFLASRVYQGSSGRVYPLPFHERISSTAKPYEWQAIHLENKWLRLVILPELGGRIHIAYDKVAEYDIFYRNNVIKPALVGLAGPWISGGVEFNWPQHHRPGTFLPTDVEIERESDGAITVWCSDHDPFARMKGMHGIRLRPDSSVIEARVRLFNRSEITQTFLWWANVAAAVGDEYQSFFPTDVTHVADHAKRAITSFPRVTDKYYGIDYPANVDAEHPDADRLDWYKNIPVPTSYMVMSTEDEFFGGYDHGRKAGFVHWASRDISPGKKQWTWGNAEFGWAWDANLTDDDGPYVELMAGVYTDNQPDFSFLSPGETKVFSQYWYPIQGIGPAHQATRLAAASVREAAENLHIGVSVTQEFSAASIVLTAANGAELFHTEVALAPGQPFIHSLPSVANTRATDLTLTVTAGEEELVAIRPKNTTEKLPVHPATEPPAPQDVASVEELFYIGQYLEQYRHATRSPEPYWTEALRREPGDLRSNIALAARRYAAADFEASATHLRTALARQEAWVPNPADGEAHYRLGLALTRLGLDHDAERHFAKAAWNSGWSAPAQFALGKLRARAHAFEGAAQALGKAIQSDPEHLQALDLLARVLRELGRDEEATSLIDSTLQRDPLDQWARHLDGRTVTTDAPTLLDVALEYASAGFNRDALEVLDLADAHLDSTALGQVNVGPLISYHRAGLLNREGRHDEAAGALDRARTIDPGLCFPSRLDDVATLRSTIESAPNDSRAAALLGHWYYDRDRRTDAIALWETALRFGADTETTAIVNRNLGIAAYNVSHDKERARAHYEAALAAAPDDAKLWQEFDELLARAGENTASRLARLASRPDIIARRDDLTVTYSRLLTDEGRAGDALDVLTSRQFQPWEGGEGEVILAWDQATLALAGEALDANDSNRAIELLQHALVLPHNLGEARHPLANNAELHLALGDALFTAGRLAEATESWRSAAESEGDFNSMATQAYSRQTVFSILALRRLADNSRADRLTSLFRKHINDLASTPARIDYFATSLPTMLLFTDDPQTARNDEVAALRDMLRRLVPPVDDDLTAFPAVEAERQ
ncbi:MAG: Tetratricopeptide repeat protein [Glaciihabitans sp.]|nr:Tetratricopeptide repeat protein [Glaciihabitans sp.]